MDSAYKLHFDRYLRLPETLRPERFRETLRPTHDRNSEVWISLVEERVAAMESGLRGSFLFQKLMCILSILQNSHLLNCNLIQLL